MASVKAVRHESLDQHEPTRNKCNRSRASLTIRSKVAVQSGAHGRRRELSDLPLLITPPGTHQSSPKIIVIIPIHQTTFFKYAWPSPAALPAFCVADSKPRFLITKLAPINKPLPTARHTPTILYAGGAVVEEDDAAVDVADAVADETIEESVSDIVPWKESIELSRAISSWRRETGPGVFSRETGAECPHHALPRHDTGVLALSQSDLPRRARLQPRPEGAECVEAGQAWSGLFGAESLRMQVREGITRRRDARLKRSQFYFPLAITKTSLPTRRLDSRNAGVITRQPVLKAFWDRASAGR